MPTIDPTPPTLTESPLHGVTRLDQWGLIRAQGEDAAQFIHGQLSQDFLLMGRHEARLAALCNAKGRMLASFIGIKTADDEILLLISADLLAATLKRLSMFVLRAKVRLSDASAEYACFGLAGAATSNNAAPWSVQDHASGHLLQLYPADGVARQLWVGPALAPAPAGDSLAIGLWQWGEVRAGVAQLTLPLVEAFVPQMLNYESIGGVSFKKGCYPGQEVVARSQFRGTLKRRAFLCHIDQAPAVGAQVFAEDNADQPVATVVQAAAAPQGGWDAIVCAQVSAVQAGRLHLESVAGSPVQLLPLPYALLEDI